MKKRPSFELNLDALHLQFGELKHSTLEPTEARTGRLEYGITVAVGDEST